MKVLLYPANVINYIRFVLLIAAFYNIKKVSFILFVYYFYCLLFVYYFKYSNMNASLNKKASNSYFYISYFSWNYR